MGCRYYLNRRVRRPSSRSMPGDYSYFRDDRRVVGGGGGRIARIFAMINPPV
jgi:hypothetical protein